MLTRIRIQNYKCLADVTLNLGPFNVLIGPNDTGKSSVLEAVFLLSELVKGRELGKGEGIPNLGEFIAHREGKTLLSFVANLRLAQTQAVYSIEISEDANVRSESLKGFSGQADFWFDVEESGRKVQTSFGDQGHPRKRTYLSVAQQDEGIAADEIVHALEARKFTPKAASIASPSPPANDPTTPVLRDDGEGLASVLDYMLLVERDSFDSLEKKLCEMVPYVRRLNVRPLGGKRIVEFSLDGDDRPIPANLASDGLLLFLGYITLLHMPGPRPGIILVDEPENGIHPKRLKEIVALLRQLREKEDVQIIMTTHSPYLLDSMKPEEVQIFTRGKDLCTKVTPMKDIPDLETLRSGYMLGEMWYNYDEEELVKGIGEG